MGDFKEATNHATIAVYTKVLILSGLRMSISESENYHNKFNLKFISSDSIPLFLNTVVILLYMCDLIIEISKRKNYVRLFTFKLSHSKKERKKFTCICLWQVQ